MAFVSWGSIKALLIFFGPILLPKAIGYYRRFQATPKSPNPTTGALSPSAIRAISVFCSLSLVFFIFALPPFATENIFYRTASRLQAPTDVLFTRLATLRPGESLTHDDAVLRSKFVNLESRLLYLQYGPDVLISCPFCSTEDPNTYWFYAAPAILKPYIFNLFALSIATSAPFADAWVSRWRSFAATTTVVIAIIELWTTAAYERTPNAKATRYTDIEVLFQIMQTSRCLALGILDAVVATLIWLSATGRMFAKPLSPAARVESVIRQLLTTKSKLSAVGIVKNTSLRDDDLRGHIEDYWTHEGKLMREVMEEREVVEGINDALTRINIRDITRDAEQYALNMFPKPPEPPDDIVIRATGP